VKSRESSGEKAGCGEKKRYLNSQGKKRKPAFARQRRIRGKREFLLGRRRPSAFSVTLLGSRSKQLPKGKGYRKGFERDAHELRKKSCLKKKGGGTAFSAGKDDHSRKAILLIGKHNSMGEREEFRRKGFLGKPLIVEETMI